MPLSQFSAHFSSIFEGHGNQGLVCKEITLILPVPMLQEYHAERCLVVYCWGLWLPASQMSFAKYVCTAKLVAAELPAF